MVPWMEDSSSSGLDLRSPWNKRLGYSFSCVLASAEREGGGEFAQVDTLAKIFTAGTVFPPAQRGLETPQGKGTGANVWRNFKDHIWLKVPQAPLPAPAVLVGTQCFAQIIPPTISQTTALGCWAAFNSEAVKPCVLLWLLFLSESLLSGYHFEVRNFCNFSEPEAVFSIVGWQFYQLLPWQQWAFQRKRERGSSEFVPPFTPCVHLCFPSFFLLTNIAWVPNLCQEPLQVGT